MRMNAAQLYELEEMIDRFGVAGVLEGMSDICNEKAEHVQSNWQDRPLARAWSKAGEVINTASGKIHLP